MKLVERDSQLTEEKTVKNISEWETTRSQTKPSNQTEAAVEKGGVFYFVRASVSCDWLVVCAHQRMVVEMAAASKSVRVSAHMCVFVRETCPLV